MNSFKKHLFKRVITIFIAIVLVIPTLTNLAAAATGELSVTLSQNTSSSGSVENSSVSVPFATFDFTATNKDIKVSRILVASDSASAYSNAQNVKLYTEDGVRVGDIVGAIGYISSTGMSVAEFELNNYFIIPAGTTSSLTIKADVTSSGSGSLRFGISEIDAISIEDNSDATISTSLPIFGNIMSIGTTKVISASISGNSPNSPLEQSSANELIAEFVFKATGGDIIIREIDIIADSENARTNIQNIKLHKAGTQYGATVSSLVDNYDGTSSYTIKPTIGTMTIPAGAEQFIQLYADIASGVTGSVRLGISRIEASGAADASVAQTQGLTVYGYLRDIQLALKEPFYLTFDNTLNDASGISPTQINSQSSIQYENGVLGKAAKFASSSSFVEYSCNEQFNQKDGTLEVLVKFDDFTTSDAVIWQTDDSNYAFYYDYASDGTEKRITARAAQEEYPAQYHFDQSTGTPNELEKSKWHHLAMTWDWSDSMNVGTTKIYIDGKLAGINQFVQHDNCFTFRVGNNYWPGMNWKDGWIDELKLYTTMRSAQEVIAAYNAYDLEVAPVINNVTVSAIVQTQAKVSWETDIPTTGTVYFRKQGENDWNTKSTGSTLLTQHSIALTNLMTGQTYQYYIVAHAYSGSKNTSTLIQTFTTKADKAPVTETPVEDEPVDETPTESEQSAKPDFIISGIELFKTNNTDGVLAIVQMKNIGVTSNGKLHVNITNDTNGTSKTYYNIEGPFVKDAGVNLTITLDPPGQIKDSYRITATADSGNAFNESNEKNNALAVNLYINETGIDDDSSSGKDNATLSVIMDPYMPTNARVVAGERHRGIARFLVSATGADAEISIIDVSTYSWTGVLKFAIPTDVGYTKPTIYDETSGKELDYEFSNLSWGNATVTLKEPLIIRENQTKSIRIDATPKRGVSGRAAFSLDKIDLKNNDGVSYPVIASRNKGNTKQGGNMFYITDSPSSNVSTVNIALDSKTPPAANIDPNATNIKMASYKLSAIGGDISVSEVWFVSDSPNAEDLFYYIKLVDDTGTEYVDSRGFPVETLFHSQPEALLAHGFLELGTPIVIPQNRSKTVHIMVSAIGNVNTTARLGIAGLGFFGGVVGIYETMEVKGNLPIFGKQMTIGDYIDISAKSNKNTQKTSSDSSEVSKLRERIRHLELKISNLERNLIESEKRLTQKIDKKLTQRVTGKILLQVEGNGEAWYVDPVSEERYYLRDGTRAHSLLQVFGLGITNTDLAKIPIGIEDRAEILDSDNDGLDDRLEESLGTNIYNPDSDNDGFTDAEEIKNGFSPLGSGRLAFDSSLANRIEGKILLQVEDKGQAWYMYNGKRYYMKDGQQAYQIMRFLSLGITNNDLRKISVGELE